jgi:hypothetical protein
MISIDECKEYIGDLGLTDTQIEVVRGLIYPFVERGLDFMEPGGTLQSSESYDKK